MYMHLWQSSPHLGNHEARILSVSIQHGERMISRFSGNTFGSSRVQAGIAELVAKLNILPSELGENLLGSFRRHDPLDDSATPTELADAMVDGTPGVWPWPCASSVCFCVEVDERV